MSCPCTHPSRWQPVPPCACSTEQRLARALQVLGDLTRAAGESPAQETDRAFNSAYSAAVDFLEANADAGDGRPPAHASDAAELAAVNALAGAYDHTDGEGG